MKKGLLLLLVSVFGLTLLTGCGGSSKKVTCTAKIESSGDSAGGSAEIVAELDDSDKVKGVSATMKFESEEEASQAYGMMSFVNAMIEQQGEGDKIDVKLDGKTLTINNFDAYAGMDSEEKLIGMSKEDFIKAMEADEEMKATCK